ncbi:MAG: DinB family protein [Planctomycetota bacterium]
MPVIDTNILGVRDAAGALLAQATQLLESLSDEAYRTNSEILQGGTIGKHVRHVVDHFAAPLCDEAAECVDYDHRERDVPMETDRAAAIEKISGLRRQLAELTEDDLRAPLRIRVMLAGDGTCAELPSSLGRELFFAFHHAVHHNAMIGAIAREHGAQTVPGFGTAPSTLNHEAGRGVSQKT